MKMKRKQIGMLVFIAIIVILMVVTSQTPGTIADADSYQCKVYATILSRIESGYPCKMFLNIIILIILINNHLCKNICMYIGKLF